jgi:hypothetical protein
MLHVVVHRRFLGRDEARAHVHALGAQRERRDERAAVGHTARGDERDIELLRGARQQDEVRDIVLAGMTAALEAIHADGVAADLLGLERVPHRCALVNDLDAMLLERGQILLGIVAGRLDDLHAAFDDRADVAWIIRWCDRRQERQVHAERLVRHRAAACDLLREQLGRPLGEARDDAQASRVGDGRRQLRQPDEVHTALDNGMANSE